MLARGKKRERCLLTNTYIRNGLSKATEPSLVSNLVSYLRHIVEQINENNNNKYDESVKPG